MAELVEVYPDVMCPKCIHFDGDVEHPTCPAFPDGIPNNIILGGAPHFKVTRGQEGGTVFTPLPGLEWMLRAAESEEEYQARVDAEWVRNARPMTIETPSEAIRPEHRVVLIKIPRSAPADGDPAALLEATSKWWVVSESRRGGGPASPEYALAVSRGRVVVAYRIYGWQRAPSGPRWGFVGKVSAELTALYRGVDVTTYFPPGAATPLRYVNCVATTGWAEAPRESTAEVVELKRNELDETVKRLKEEPLTHLMLGHRELLSRGRSALRPGGQGRRHRSEGDDRSAAGRPGRLG